jgi:diphthamide synthase subunit DPH2
MSEKKRKKKVKEEIIPEPEPEEDDEELQEIENPYTVTNRAITELVDPKDTMFYLSESQIKLILTAFEFSALPTYFGEEMVKELADFADRLRYYLVSKAGRGRRDVLRVLKVSSGQVRENVNKSLFKRLIEGGSEEEDETED